MNTKAIIVLVGAVLVVGTVLWVGMEPISSFFAKQETVNPGDKVITARIGETKTEYGITLGPLQVLEDSRCPTDVQCIQAGTVRVLVSVTQGADQSAQELQLGTPFILVGGAVTLTKVTPEPRSQTPISPSDYTFTFTVNSATDTE